MVDDGDPAAARRKPSYAGGVGPDLISALPDDLLLAILLRLPTIEAIRTCLLSRLWRTLWTQLPELRFNEEDAGVIQRVRFADLVDGALRRSGPGDISTLEISVADASSIDAVRLAAWHRVAAQRVTGRFDFVLQPMERDDFVLELPCFPKAKRIFLMIACELRLPRPEAGTFACLIRLELLDLRFSGEGAALGDVVSSCCPRLETLHMLSVYNLRELTLRTESLLELRMVFVPDLQRLDVVASNLWRMHLSGCFTGSNTMNKGPMALLVHAPLLELVDLHRCCPQEMQFVDKRHLQKLAVRGFVFEVLKGNSTRILQNFSHINHLKLHISMPLSLLENPRLMEPIELPRHLELELVLLRDEHSFGSSTIPPLKACKDTRKLTCTFISINSRAGYHCAPECICHQQTSWSDAKIRFDSLQELVLNGFKARPDETSFLHFVFRCAGALKSVSIALSKFAKPSADFYDDILSSSPAGCSVVFL